MCYSWKKKIIIKLFIYNIAFKNKENTCFLLLFKVKSIKSLKIIGILLFFLVKNLNINIILKLKGRREKKKVQLERYQQNFLIKVKEKN